jgi:hypothetical protein
MTFISTPLPRHAKRRRLSRKDKPMTSSRCMLSAASALIAAGLLGGPAHAQTAPAAPDSSAAPAKWSDAITLGLQIEGGITINPATPKTNFGQLFTDHPNQPTLNQALVTFARDIPKDTSGWDVGFHFTGLYGSDARYTHFLGIADYALAERYQLDVVEASASVHMPVLVGLDVKAGLYPTPLGFETIDPSTNPFYSHSYIFNFGIPLKHSGVLAVLHATDYLDVYGGVDTGVNTTFGDQQGDNNGTVAGLFGFGFTLLGGNLTGVALTHFGPENAALSATQPLGLYNANHFNRYENDAYVTYKWNDKLSTTTEFNYIKDENPLINAPEGWGIAQYAAYTLTDTITLNARAEVFRDGKGFYVAYFPGIFDYVNAEYGKPNTAVAGPHATYGEITLGTTWKPALPKPISGLLIRPELRYDTTLAGPAAFNNGKDRGSFTIATDFVLSF